MNCEPYRVIVLKGYLKQKALRRFMTMVIAEPMPWGTNHKWPVNCWMGTPTWQLSIGDMPTSCLSMFSARGEMVWLCVRTSGKFRWQFHRPSPAHRDISKIHFRFNIWSHMIRRLATFARKPLCAIMARYWQLFKQAEFCYWKLSVLESCEKDGGDGERIVVKSIVVNP